MCLTPDLSGQVQTPRVAPPAQAKPKASWLLTPIPLLSALACRTVMCSVEAVGMVGIALLATLMSRRMLPALLRAAVVMAVAGAKLPVILLLAIIRQVNLPSVS